MGMKVNGKPINGARIATLVLPYGEGDDFIVFKFRALTAKDNFEKIMPRPKPARHVKPGGQEFFDYEDPRYKLSVDAWAENKINWEFLRSISATEGLEWETVKMEDYQTWKNWRTEMEESFGMVDFGHIFGGFLEANSLNEAKLEEARARFLASLVPEA